MLKLLFRIGAAIALTTCAAQAQPETGNPYGFTGDDVPAIGAVTAAAQANVMGQFSASLSILSRTKADPNYEKFSPKAHYAIDMLYGEATQGKYVFNEAHKAFQRATQYPDATEEAWVARFETALDTNDYADADVTFAKLRESFRDFVDNLSGDFVFRFERGLLTLPKSEERQFAFEDYLYEDGWLNGGTTMFIDTIRFHYAMHLMDKGNKERAAHILDKITSPHIIAVLKADKRFDAVLASNSDKFDVDAALKEKVEQSAAMQFKSLLPLCACEIYSSALYEAGRFDDSVKTIDKALRLIAPLMASVREADPSYDEHYTNLLFQRALSLFALGRTDEAVGVASGLQWENCCGQNSDMPAVMGQFLVWMGKGQEANEYLASFPRNYLAPQDVADTESLQVCAQIESHQTSGIQYELSELRKAVYEPGAAIQGYLCADRLDDAANFVIAELADPQLRALALDQLQIYSPAAVQTEMQKSLQAKFAALRERPDVLAAVAKIGRINRYSIVTTHWIY